MDIDQSGDYRGSEQQIIFGISHSSDICQQVDTVGWLLRSGQQGYAIVFILTGARPLRTLIATHRRTSMGGSNEPLSSGGKT